MAPAVDLDEAAWDRVLEVNLTAVFRLTRAVGAVMLRQGRGKVITIASVSSTVANPAGDGPTPPGSAAFLTQSGAFGTAMVGLGRQHGLAFGYFVNSGNEADLTFADLLGWIVADPKVRVVAGYIEGLHDGRRLLAVADRALEAGKPLVITKAGRSAAGARAAASHTALAGEDRVYADVFRQKGISDAGPRRAR